jgi:hypothetical protein
MHTNTKFKSREDGNYRNVRNVLRSFVRKIRESSTSSPLFPPGTRNTHARIDNPERKLLEPGSPIVAAVALDQILGIKDIGEDLDTFRKRLQPHSCHWILQKQSFRDWVEGAHEDSQTLYWLTGPPAVGKTTLSSFVINYLKQGYIPGTCAYHFFQAEHHNNRTISYCLRSLAFQIAQEHEEFRLVLVSAYKKSRMTFASQKYQIIWDKIFEGMLFRLKLHEPLFWVLDGLDEAESPGVLCDLITKITSATPVKVILVSRPTKDLLLALSIK